MPIDVRMRIEQNEALAALVLDRVVNSVLHVDLASPPPPSNDYSDYYQL
jgi:hypothetical protein